MPPPAHRACILCAHKTPLPPPWRSLLDSAGYNMPATPSVQTGGRPHCIACLLTFLPHLHSDLPATGIAATTLLLNTLPAELLHSLWFLAAGWRAACWHLPLRCLPPHHATAFMPAICALHACYTTPTNTFSLLYSRTIINEPYRHTTLPHTCHTRFVYFTLLRLHTRRHAHACSHTRTAAHALFGGSSPWACYFCIPVILWWTHS